MKCPYKYIQMFRFSSVLVTSIILILFTSEFSCSKKEEKRPSPLVSDSTVIDGTGISIHYSSPGVKKRTIWGELVPYGEVWRTGANEATYISLTDSMLIQGNPVGPGKYAIFTIPTDSTWAIIFNEEWDQWGSYNYDESRDVFRVMVKPRRSDYTERMTFTFIDGNLQFEWENLYYQLSLRKP